MGMKDLFNRAVSLGFGVAAQSKEQIEKAVDELVKKGEITRSESSDLINELLTKGQEAKRNVESIVNERVQKLTGSHLYATKEQVEALLKRIEQLEQKVAELSQKGEGSHAGGSSGETAAVVTEEQAAAEAQAESPLAGPDI
jgi:polyhydroxyalkanoate synthesis regulator phasin